jgi:hypothetical protein
MALLAEASRRSHKAWLVGLLVLAAALRLGWVMLVPTTQYSDSV